MDKRDEQIIQLETSISELERFQSELSATVADQWQIIDRLQKKLDRMSGDVERLEDRLDNPDDQQKPPHY